MNGDSGNIKQYNAADIHRYVEGKMTDPEMHAIEKAALEDPFLADAIDGYSEANAEHGITSIEKSVADLHRAFSERIKDEKKRKVVSLIGMKWWQAAAAAVIIITAGVLGYLSYTDRAETLLLTVNETNDNSNSGSTRVDSATQEPSAFSRDSLTVSSETRQGKTTQAATTQRDNRQAETTRAEATRAVTMHAEADRTNPAQAETSQGEKRQAETARAREAIKKQSIANAENEQEKEAGNLATAKDIASATNAAKRDARAAPPLQKTEYPESNKNTIAKTEADSSVSRTLSQPETKLSGKVAGIAFESPKPTINERSVNYFNGRIVTSDNKPLSNAMLKLNNSDKVYTTDNNGKFRIASADSVIEVEASMAGSETTRFRIQKNDEANQLILPDATNELSEVVVIGYGTQRKKNITGAVTVDNKKAEPEGGWIALEEYLQKNKDSTLNLNGTAETTLSFQVNTKNDLTHFRVIKSVSSRHDQDVIRLIKEGPKWKLLKGKKATVTITVKF
jgi:hypothetical protein